jgi:type II secretion system protein I
VSTTTRPGFSLLEAVVALAILGLAAVAALTAVAAELRAAGSARDAMEAVALAGIRLERLRLLPAEDLRPLADSLARGRFDPPFDRYHWSADVRRARDESDLLEVTVLVEWDSGSHGLTTRLFRPRAQGVRP